MTRSKIRLLAALAASIAWMPLSAHAQLGEEVNDTAQQLHEEGRALMKQQRYQAAYDTFHRSLTLRDNMSTRFRLAQCAEKLGRLATARSNYERVVQQARKEGQPDREAFARSAAAEVQPRVPTITLALASPKGTNGDIKVVLRDSRGQAVSLAAGWGKAMPLDGGKYVVIVTAPGHQPWSAPVTLRNEHHHLRVTIPALEPLPPEPAPAPLPPPSPISSGAVLPPGPRSSIQPVPEPKANDQVGDDGGMLIGGIITSATGVVMLASGVAMVLVGEAHYADSAPFCSLSQFCEPSGLDLRKQARTEAIIGVVLGSAGLAATGIGAGMWIAASVNDEADSPDVQVGVRVSPAGLSLIGKW